MFVLMSEPALKCEKNDCPNILIFGVIKVKPFVTLSTDEEKRTSAEER